MILRLDHDEDEVGDGGDMSSGSHGATTRAEIETFGAVPAGRPIRGGRGGGGGGGWAEGQHECKPEEPSKKRPLGGGGIAAQPVDRGSGKRGKTTPPPPSSWLSLRRALHERYRDSEEHRAAEQTEAEAAERGRRSWGGPGPNGGRGGWGGEVMYPGLRRVSTLACGLSVRVFERCDGL